MWDLDDFLDEFPWSYVGMVCAFCMLFACASELTDVRIELAEAKEELATYQKAVVDAAPKVRMDCAELPDENGKYDCKPVEVQY